MDAHLEQFFNHLITKAHPANLPKPLVDKMMADLTLQLDQRLHEAIIISLPTAADRIAYQQKFLNGATAEELKPWLTDRVPDHAKLMQYICQQFEQDYLTVCAQ